MPGVRPVRLTLTIVPWDGYKNDKFLARIGNGHIECRDGVPFLWHGLEVIRHEMDHETVKAKHHPWWHFCGMTSKYRYSILPILGRRHLTATRKQAMRLYVTGELEVPTNG